MKLKEQLLNHLSIAKSPTGYASRMKSDPVLSAKVWKATKKYNPINISEAIYIILVKPPKKLKCGNYPRFSTYGEGYAPTCQLGKKCKTCVAEGQKKSRATLKAKTGFEYPLQSKESQDNWKSTNKEKYGTEYGVQSQTVIDKRKENFENKTGYSSSQSMHISREALDIILSSEKFIAFIQGKTRSEVEEQLGISQSYRYKLSIKYDCQYQYKGVVVSKPEKELQEFLTELSIPFRGSVKDILPNNLELDILISDKELAIEYGGLYYHTELAKPKSKGRGKDYHQNKWQLCKNRGIQLITIFEDEWIDNPNLVKSIIKNKLGLSEKGNGARAYSLTELSSKNARKFFKSNHIQGYANATVSYGLIDTQNTIVAAMSFIKQNRFSKKGTNDNTWEIVRFATNGLSIPGAASKLLSRFETVNKPSKLISYADLRYGEGKVYEKLGFTFIRTTAPGYFYTDNYSSRQSRQKFQKHKLVKDGFNASKTEWQIMQERDFDRIWDCGHNLYEKLYQ